MTRLAFAVLLTACASHRSDVTPDSGGGSGSDRIDAATGDSSTGDSSSTTYDCTGVAVPGDYATLQVAIDAVANANADATICLGEGTLPGDGGSFEIRDAGHHGKVLHIMGRSRELTHLAGYVESTSSGWASVTIEHLTIDAPNAEALTVLYGPPQFVARDLTITGAIDVDSYYVGQVQALFDRCDIGTQSQGRSVMLVSDQQPVAVTITNSYLRGGLVSQSWQSTVHPTLSFVNDTVSGAATGIDLQAPMTATIANSIFTGASIAAMAWDSGTVVTAHHNAVWANAANYARYAVEGTSYVKSDCQLDGEAPVPGLGAGSPCRGAGDAGVAPDHDFYAHARGGAIDIGAVEMP